MTTQQNNTAALTDEAVGRSRRGRFGSGKWVEPPIQDWFQINRTKSFPFPSDGT